MATASTFKVSLFKSEPELDRQYNPESPAEVDRVSTSVNEPKPKSETHVSSVSLIAAAVRTTSLFEDDDAYSCYSHDSYSYYSDDDEPESVANAEPQFVLELLIPRPPATLLGKWGIMAYSPWLLELFTFGVQALSKPAWFSGLLLFF